MSKVSNNLLSDTLNLVQLARETALARGNQTHAARLNPVVSDLKTIVTKNKPVSQPANPSGVLAQSDFQSLLNIKKSGALLPSSSVNTYSPDRNQTVIAMASGGMSGIDIARQMGMTREEVETLVQANQKSGMIGR
jgi:hypothetical protein